MPLSVAKEVWSFVVNHLHATDKMSQPTTNIYYRKECGAQDSTKANLTEDVFQLLIVVQVLLFHIIKFLKS